MDITAGVDRLARLDTTVVSDALDKLGLPAGVGHLRPQWGSPRLYGIARTVELESDPGDELGPHIMTEVIADAAPGDVVVVANGGRTDVSCWGGLLSLGSVRRGLSGVIADGACRDIAEACSYGFPIFARGVAPRTARRRLRQKQIGGVVTIAGVKVAEGDLIIADDSGVTFIPQGSAAEVLDEAERIAARESAIAADIRGGAAMTTAMHDARLAGADDATEVTDGGPGIVQRLSALPTAAISDALDKLGLAGQLDGIGPLLPGQNACGPAYTAAYEPVADGGTVGDFLDDVSAGDIVVIDNRGRTDCTVWGGILTELAAAAGIAATVINGVCRDVDTITTMRYPIWSAGRFMRTGKDRVRLTATQQPITIGPVTIRPSDLVCGDEDGVVVVPAEHAHDVADIAERIEAAETAIVTAVKAGATLAEARTCHGYHSLQSRGAHS